MIDGIKSAFRNLKSKRVRTALTITGIAVGVASVIVIANISLSGSNAVTNEMEGLGLDSICVTASGSNVSLNENDLKTIKNLEQVKQAEPIIMETTNISIRNKESKAVLCGVDSNADEIVSIQAIYGRLFSTREVVAAQNVCLVDENFAKKLYSRGNIIGKKIPIDCGGIQQEFDVVGVVKTGTSLLQNIVGDYIPTFIYMPYTTMQLSTGINSYNEIAVKIKAGSDTDGVGNIIVDRLNSSNGTYDSYKSNNLAKQKNGLTNILNIVTLILSSIGGISLLVAGLSIMTVMLVSVNERTREIGIKKALGATRGMIMLEFLAEATLISAIGCLFGIFAGYAISYFGALYYKITLTFRLDIILLSGSLALMSGIVFGVYPAYKASKLKPVDALRRY